MRNVVGLLSRRPLVAFVLSLRAKETSPSVVRRVIWTLRVAHAGRPQSATTEDRACSISKIHQWTSLNDPYLTTPSCQLVRKYW